MQPIRNSNLQVMKWKERAHFEPSPWERFYKQFSHKQRLAFFSSQSRFLSQLIAKNLRKMQESLKKLREHR